MKPSKYAFAASVLCASALAAGLCFCIVTSFQVPVHEPALVCACLCAAFLFSSLFLLPKSWIWLLGIGVLTVGGAYALRTAVVQSASALVYAVSSQYAEAFSGLQAFMLTESAAAPDATLVLILLAAVYVLLCSWTVMRGESLVYLLLAVMPVLALCLIILQTPPAAWAILLVVGSMSLLLLSQTLRFYQEQEGNRLALLLALPLTVLIGLLAVLFPAKTYTRAAWSDSLQETVAAAADKLTLFRKDAQTGQVKFVSPISPSTLGSYLWDSSVSSVNLNRIGPQTQFGRSVMRVKSDRGGKCHLRGDSMAIYENNRWKALSDAEYQDVGEIEDIFLSVDSAVSWSPLMEIETDMKSGIYYLPYYPNEYPADAVPVYDAYVRNPMQQTSYAISYCMEKGIMRNDAYENFVHDTYTQVPDETRQELADILTKIGVDPAETLSRKAAAVAEYVSGSAVYDLNTPSVPDGEDFVSWFLHDSDTGYCVHFATAAAILLRCLDVPARYVTGYNMTLTENAWTTVTSDDAHAWVEYYVDGKGWFVLDPTPAAAAQTGAESKKEQEMTPEENKSVPSEAEPEISPTINEQNRLENSDNSEMTAEKQKKNSSVILAVWTMLTAAALLLIWRAILFSVRKAALGKGSCNRRAITLYHHICWISKKSKTDVPEEFLVLAEKAKFSHHKLTADELRPMQEYMDRQTEQLLEDKRFWRQFVYRVLYALR